MSETEKLIELIGGTCYGIENCSTVGTNFQRGFIEKIANHLLANGVRLETKQATSDKTSGNNALKPCPFCGGYAMIARIPAVYATPTFFATCVDCGVETPRVAKTREHAAEAWNRRAVPNG